MKATAIQADSRSSSDSDTTPKEISLPRRPYAKIGILIPHRTGPFIIHAIGGLKSRMKNTIPCSHNTYRITIVPCISFAMD